MMPLTDWKKALLASPECWTGGVMIGVGLAALATGAHDLLAHALAPFGAGLILSDVVAKKVRVRRDE